MSEHAEPVGQEGVAPRPASLFSFFNVFAAIVILGGLVITVLRFTKGLGAVTNLDHSNP